MPLINCCYQLTKNEYEFVDNLVLMLQEDNKSYVVRMMIDYISKHDPLLIHRIGEKFVKPNSSRKYKVNVGIDRKKLESFEQKLLSYPCSRHRYLLVVAIIIFQEMEKQRIYEIYDNYTEKIRVRSSKS
ncbi:hypothetical protein [Nostoc phage N1]|nr:hypothetical protein [Nostoc phage N1]